MTKVWLGIGTNIGDRSSHIRAAVESLDGIFEHLVMASCYETAAQDYIDQPDFLNTVVRGETSLAPLELLERINAIEVEGGRDRNSSTVKGPRTIDIDILLFASLCHTFYRRDGSMLTIPHKSMHARLFVLQPLLELDPDTVDPRDGISWSIKASHLSGQRVKLYRK